METQKELDVEFVESYKRLEGLLKDIYSNENPVSGYIVDMEKVGWFEYQHVLGWESDFKALKRARHIRNNLSHDTPYGQGDTMQNDLEWIKNFYQRFLDSDDPLARLRRYRQSWRVLKQERLEERKFKDVCVSSDEYELEERKFKDVSVSLDEYEREEVEPKRPEEGFLSWDDFIGLSAIGVTVLIVIVLLITLF